MTLLEQAATFISRFEGFSAKPYQNPGDRPTIGFGNTFYEDGSAVTLDDTAISQDRATELLQYFVQRCIDHVTSLVTISLNPNQTTALVSFQYNTGALSGSTLLTRVNENDLEAAADEFLRWTHASGRVLPGLVTRREAERSLFLTPEDV